MNELAELLRVTARAQDRTHRRETPLAIQLRQAADALDDADAAFAKIARELEAMGQARDEENRRARTAEAQLQRLRRASRAVVDATTQDAGGQWVVTGDGEVLVCSLAEALAPVTDETAS